MHRTTIVITALAALYMCQTTLADAPPLMTYQGLLTDSLGSTLDTTLSMTFTIYDTLESRTTLWTETHDSVLVSNGVFNVLLGSVNPLSDTVFNVPDRWLGVRVGSDPEMTPRTRIASVAYAFQGDETQTGDSDWTITGDDMYSAVSGNVGIGTATPGSKLDVYGHVRISSGSILSLDGAAVENYLEHTGDDLSVIGVPGLMLRGDEFVSVTCGPDEAINIDEYGMVGIGMDNPSSRLDVNGRVESSSGGFKFPDGTTQTTAAQGDGHSLDAADGFPIDALYVDNDGEVGIGTASPNYPLHVESDAQAIRGKATNLDGIAIYGLADNTDQNSAGIGVYGRSDSDDGAGVFGEATYTGGTAYGVRGVAAQGTGVYGESQFSGNFGALGRYFEGVYGESDYGFSGIGVHGKWTGESPGYGFGGAFSTTSHLGAGVLAQNESDSSGGSAVLGLSTFSGSGESYGGYFEAASSQGHAVHAEASGDSAYAVYGKAIGDSGIAVYGEVISGTAGHFSAGGGSARGVYAIGGTGGYFEGVGYHSRGVQALGAGTEGRGVFGEANGNDAIGVYGKSDGTNGIGVYGEAMSDIGVHYGGYFTADGPGHALYAKTESDDNNSRAIYAENLTTNESTHYAGYFYSTSNKARAVYGLVDEEGSFSDTTYGGYFESRSNYGFGVYGVATSPYYAGAAVCGEAFGEGSAGIKGINSENSWAGYFDGPVYNSSYAEVAADLRVGGEIDVGGIVTGGAGSSRIDHPLDPENKYLHHARVESPDMMNIYNGNVVTNSSGEAWVQLPDWFEALNRDFRYQLTVIGQFAQAIVAQKIEDNRFLIRTDKPNTEVSWQVTGIRRDAYAEANRVQVEVDKPANERGSYLHSEAWGKPVELHVDQFRDPLKEALGN
jgi:hypothetical protein